MRYPVVPMATCLDLAAEFVRRGQRDLNEHEIQESGSGPELDLSSVTDVASTMSTRLDEFERTEHSSDKDLFEGLVAAQLHKSMRDIETTILDDPGFWRYLTLDHFWWFVRWREEGAFEKADPGKYLRYVDGTRNTECVLIRAYLRGQAVETDGDYSLGVIEQAGDFWRSHVLRVSTGAVPAVAKAFAEEHKRDRMVTSVLRPFARRLNRVSTNVVLPVLSDDDARALMGELRE